MTKKLKQKKDNINNLLIAGTLNYIRELTPVIKNCFNNCDKEIWLNYHFLEIEKIYNNLGYEGLIKYFNEYPHIGISDVSNRKNEQETPSKAVVEFQPRVKFNKRIIGAYIHDPKEYCLRRKYPHSKIILLTQECDERNDNIQLLLGILIFRHITQIIDKSNDNDLFITKKNLIKASHKNEEDRINTLYKKMYKR